jgi:Macrocin-O-methyltransferase (TylF)
LPVTAATAEVIARVRQDHLSYLKPVTLEELAAAVEETESSGRPGLLIEAGAALGGSAIVMASAKSRGRPLRVYDAFAMIPPPSDKDGEKVHARYEKIVSGRARGVGGKAYYGYREDLLSEVTASFERYGLPLEESNVKLIKGYFEDTLYVDEPVALAHLDGDWYESTMTCLERIEPRLVPGGRFIIDDYFRWSGCHRAVDEYFAGRPGYELVKHHRMHVVKAAPKQRSRLRWWRSTQ